VSSWNVARATNLKSMFYLCNSFDCDISGWDVTNATDMHSMFGGCRSFINGNRENVLASWNLPQATSLTLFEIDLD